MFQDEIQKAVKEIQANHNKIIDDWCKVYMAQRYKEGKSIDVGSFALCQQNLSWAQNEVGFKYWFEDSKPTYESNSVKLFYGNNFYPLGGFEDFKGYFNSVEAAKQHVENELKNENYMWCHIVLDEKIVLRGGTNDFINPGWEWENEIQ